MPFIGTFHHVLVCSVDRARIIYNHYYKFLMGSGLGTVVTKFCSMPGCCQWLIYFIFIFDKSLSQLKSGFWWVFFCLVQCAALGVFFLPAWPLIIRWTLRGFTFVLSCLGFDIQHPTLTNVTRSAYPSINRGSGTWHIWIVLSSSANRW